MDTSTRIYTVEPYPEGLILRRNGQRLCCPRCIDVTPCGEWCPAFEIIPGVEKIDGREYPGRPASVRLSCFPQETTFIIQEVSDESSNQD